MSRRYAISRVNRGRIFIAVRIGAECVAYSLQPLYTSVAATLNRHRDPGERTRGEDVGAVTGHRLLPLVKRGPSVALASNGLECVEASRRDQYSRLLRGGLDPRCDPGYSQPYYQ